VIEHLFSHFVSGRVHRRVDEWVAAGQRIGAIHVLDGATCQLTFGFRYRLLTVLVSLVFGIFFCLFCWSYLTAPQPDFWLSIAYFGFVLPVFLLSVILAGSACTTRVNLSFEGIVVRRFGMESARAKWCDIAQVYRSRVTPNIVFVTSDHHRLRISTQLDGLEAIPEYLKSA
jgi:hypothetical protein